MYAIDADVFIQAKNRHYGFDFCPAFWHWLDEAHGGGRVLSVTKIGEELRAGADELAAWASERAGFFVPPDEAAVSSLTKISAWATGANYAPAAVSTFLAAGDYFLIGHAHAHGLTVVTHEIASGSLKKIKIPDACAALGVSCVDPYAMLKAERAKFVLGR